MNTNFCESYTRLDDNARKRLKRAAIRYGFRFHERTEHGRYRRWCSGPARTDVVAAALKAIG